MSKNIVINYSDCEDGVHCDVSASEPVNAQEILYGLSATISLFSQNVGVHPIQVAAALQQMIVENSFSKIKKEENQENLEKIN